MPRKDWERVGNLALGGLLVISNAAMALLRLTLNVEISFSTLIWILIFVGIAVGSGLLFLWWRPRPGHFRTRPDRSDCWFDIVMGLAILAGFGWMLFKFGPSIRPTLQWLILLLTMAAWLPMGLWMFGRGLVKLKGSRWPGEAAEESSQVVNDNWQSR